MKECCKLWEGRQVKFIENDKGDYAIKGVQFCPVCGESLDGKEATIQLLENIWMKSLFRRSKIEKYLIIKPEEANDKITKRVYELFTDRYKYHIIAIERHPGKSYLGCTVSCRKPYAGENHTRGNDLSDGELTKETWYRIIFDIVEHELVELAPQFNLKHKTTCEIKGVEIPIADREGDKTVETRSKIDSEN